MIRVKKTFLVLVIASFGYALFSGGNLPYSIFYALFLMLILMGVSTYILGRGLKVKIDSDKYEMVTGDNNKIVIKVYNNSIFPVPYLEVKNSLVEKVMQRHRGDITTIGIGSQKFLNKEINIGIRGQYGLGETSCSTSDVFGIFTYKKPYKHKKFIKVYPKTYELNSVRINGANLREYNIKNIKPYNKGPESAETIRNIREYRRGDSYKRINWKITAKHGKLFVKEYDSSESPRIHIFLDLRMDGFTFDKGGEKEENLVEFFLSLVNYIVKRKGNCQAIIINDNVRAFDIIGEGSYELLREHMVTTFNGGSGDLSAFMKKYLCDINKKSAVVMVSCNITKENMDYLVTLKREKYEMNLFYLNKVFGDEGEIIAEAKKQGVSCYNIEGIR